MLLLLLTPTDSPRELPQACTLNAMVWAHDTHTRQPSLQEMRGPPPPNGRTRAVHNALRDCVAAVQGAMHCPLPLPLSATRKAQAGQGVGWRTVILWLGSFSPGQWHACTCILLSG